MAKHPNAVKLDASFVPPWTHKMTLSGAGQISLQESISAKEYMQDDTLRNYFVAGNPEIASLMAKHLRLCGVPLMWCTLATLIHEQRIQYTDKEEYSRNGVLKARGSGYIVIPDLMTKEDPRTIWTRAELAQAGDFLATHVYSGGGLVLGGLDMKNYPVDCYGTDLARIVEVRSTFIVV